MHKERYLRAPPDKGAYKAELKMSNDSGEDADQACFPKACAIQTCLDKNGWDDKKCTKEIDALYECCRAFYAETNDQGKTVCCPKPSLLRLKLQQRAQSRNSK